MPVLRVPRRRRESPLRQAARESACATSRLSLVLTGRVNLERWPKSLDQTRLRQRPYGGRRSLEVRRRTDVDTNGGDAPNGAFSLALPKKPTRGLEPRTPSLRVKCSTS